MHKAKLFTLSITLVLGLYGSLGFYALPFAAFDGDLTRMAPLPETQFGWQKPQPSIDPSLLAQSPLEEADVLVIGDSFSDPRVWQTVLVDKGLKVRTELWGAMPFICEDLNARLRSAGFKGRYLVIESVERNLPHRLNDSLHCKTASYQPNSATPSERSPPPEQVDRSHKNYASKLLVAIHTMLNSMAFRTAPAQLQTLPFLLNTEVAVRPVENGCQLFSHPACSHALFYAQENADDPWQTSMQAIRELNARFTDIQPVWVVVPNKTTVYFHPQKRLWTELKRAQLGPDLLEMTRTALRNNTVDMFPANNTHLSTQGYLQLGQQVLRELGI
jgi:hypothetical protein